MKSPFLATTGVALLAVACACFHPALPDWFGWIGVGAMAVGGIMTFIGDLPTTRH